MSKLRQIYLSVYLLVLSFIFILILIGTGSYDEIFRQSSYSYGPGVTLQAIFLFYLKLILLLSLFLFLLKFSISRYSRGALSRWIFLPIIANTFIISTQYNKEKISSVTNKLWESSGTTFARGYAEETYLSLPMSYRDNIELFAVSSENNIISVSFRPSSAKEYIERDNLEFVKDVHYLLEDLYCYYDPLSGNPYQRFGVEIYSEVYNDQGQRLEGSMFNFDSCSRDI